MSRKVFALLMVFILLLSACSNGTQNSKKSKKSKAKNKSNTSQSSSDKNLSDDSSDTSQNEDVNYEFDDSQNDDYGSQTPDMNDDTIGSLEDQSKNDESFLVAVDKTNDTVPLNNTAERLNPRKGGADAQADKLRTSIMNTKDNLDTSKGNVYYISRKGNDANTGRSKNNAWYSVSAYQVARYDLKPGDTVLFERGGVYRGSFNLVSGVNYGAYGEGPKPAIYGSKSNFTGEDMWRESDDSNLWVCNDYFDQDVGLLVFNHGIAVGVKCETKEEIKKNFDFWLDPDTAELYLYLERNPGKTFYDIEVCENGNLLWGGTDCSNVTIENLAVKYHGGHGIAFGDNAKNITIRDCDIGWIGGCYLGGTERFGNGIQFWNNCNNILVENNWVYQIYDAGITHQGGAGGNIQSDITYQNNLVEYCTYAIEFFAGTPATDVMKNILMQKNILRFAGAGWGMVRTNPQAVSLICAWGGNTAFKTINFCVSDNIFDLSDNFLINQTYNAKLGIKYTGNTFYQKTGYAFNWEMGERYDSNSQAELEKSVSYVDSKPKLVKFIK